MAITTVAYKPATCRPQKEAINERLWRNLKLRYTNTFPEHSTTVQQFPLRTSLPIYFYV